MNSFLGVYVSQDHQEINRELSRSASPEFAASRSTQTSTRQSPFLTPKEESRFTDAEPDCLASERPKLALRISPKDTIKARRTASLVPSLIETPSVFNQTFTQIQSSPTCTSAHVPFGLFEPKPTTVNLSSQTTLTWTASVQLRPEDQQDSEPVIEPPTIWHGRRSPPKPWMKHQPKPSFALSNKSSPSSSSSSEAVSMAQVRPESDEDIKPKHALDDSIMDLSRQIDNAASINNDLVPTASTFSFDRSIPEVPEGDSDDEVIIISSSSKQTMDKLPAVVKPVAAKPATKRRQSLPLTRETRSPTRSARLASSVGPSSPMAKPTKQTTSKHVKRVVPLGDDDADVNLDALLDLLPKLKGNKETSPPRRRPGRPKKSSMLKVTTIEIDSPADSMEVVRSSVSPRSVTPPRASLKGKAKAGSEPVTRTIRKGATPSIVHDTRSESVTTILSYSPVSKKGHRKQRSPEGEEIASVLVLSSNRPATDNLTKSAGPSQPAAIAAVQKRKMDRAQLSEGEEAETVESSLVSSPPKKQKSCSQEAADQQEPTHNQPVASSNSPHLEKPPGRNSQQPVFSYPELAKAADTPFRPLLMRDVFLASDMDVDDLPAYSHASPTSISQTITIDYRKDFDSYFHTTESYGRLGSHSASSSSSSSDLATPVTTPITLFDPVHSLDSVGYAAKDLSADIASFLLLPQD